MNNILSQMLEKYSISTLSDEKNALKEVVQEVALCGLFRAGFFNTAAFYGGTALRIFYGLDRFSEDLDFSLLKPSNDFELSKYLSILESEIRAVGLNFRAEEKIKTNDSFIKSAFLKGNTKEHIMTVYNDLQVYNGISSGELLKIKIEVDINPPAYATYENKYRLLPSPYKVKIFDMSSLFAGKIHAVICRAWRDRVKGRDLYDYVFYLSQNATVNLPHLNARLVDSGFINNDFKLNREKLIKILKERFATIDYTQAKNDVLPFIRDKSKLELWSKEFFQDITESIVIAE